jgi:hypothetical protein
MRQIARRASGRGALGLLLLAALGLPADLSTAFAAARGDDGIFSVAAPTGDPAADLAAIEAARAKAKAWQARQPKGADGLAAKTEVVLAPGTYGLCPTGGNPPPTRRRPLLPSIERLGKPRVSRSGKRDEAGAA